ncbi:MAG: CBS domain-containing protein, partial [Spirochaetia bacterium]|nr:CBS domain-containing protein [Spirochaetia bacterium]
MDNIISATNDEKKEEKTSRIKNLLNQIFTKNDTIRHELIQFFEDMELPVRNDQIQMILGVIHLLGFTAEKIKIPLAKITALSDDNAYKNVIKIINSTGHSRIPVYEEKGGHRKYIGLLYAKDLLKSVGKKLTKFSLKDYIRTIQVVPETQSLLSLLRDMRMRRQHMMLTANEYGEVTGLITLEDILEEIVGEIKDEYDSKKETIEEVGHRLYKVDASMNLSDINKQLAINLPEENFNTLAGFMLHELKGNVQTGSQVAYGKITLLVSEYKDQTIIKATVFIPPDIM